MTKTFASVLLIACAAGAAEAQMAYWRFPGVVPPGGDNFKITFPVAADVNNVGGTAQITTDGLVWDGTAAPPATGQGNFQYFSGTTINAVGADVAGSGFSFRSGVAGASNGKSVTFQFSSLGFSDIIMTFAERFSGTAAASDIAVSTSTDGVNFTPQSAYSSVNPTNLRDGTFRLRTIDLSAVDSLENVSAAYVRFTFNGFSTTSATGTWRIDNVQFNGIPTPGSAALLAIAGLAATRRRR